MRLIGSSSSTCCRNVSAFLLCNIVMISRTSHGVFRFSASAWMPRYPKRPHGRGALSMLVRGGSDYSNYCPIFHAPSPSRNSHCSTSSSSATVALHSTTSAEAEATEYAASLCGDDLSVKAASNFGGLKYFNTDIDGRFRVLFVLGGPGKS